MMLSLEINIYKIKYELNKKSETKKKRHWFTILSNHTHANK